MVGWVRQFFPGLHLAFLPLGRQRPIKPDMMPRIKAGSRLGVFYNTDYGHRGWTLSAVSAELVAEMVPQAPRRAV
ncbi:FAD-dependent oxidoreductase [Ensifer canadensis]